MYVSLYLYLAVSLMFGSWVTVGFRAAGEGEVGGGGGGGGEEERSEGDSSRLFHRSPGM